MFHFLMILFYLYLSWLAAKICFWTVLWLALAPVRFAVTHCYREPAPAPLPDNVIPFPVRRRR
jgi:hypothetical protein